MLLLLLLLLRKKTDRFRPTKHQPGIARVQKVLRRLVCAVWVEFYQKSVLSLETTLSYL